MSQINLLFFQKEKKNIMAMGKLLNALLIVIAIEFAIVLFMGTTTPSSQLYDFVTGQDTWKETGSYFIATVQGWFALAAVAGIIVGLIYRERTDFFIFASITAVFLSYGAIIYNIKDQFSGIEFLNNNPIFIWIFLAPILIAYVYVSLKFWRGND